MRDATKDRDKIAPAGGPAVSVAVGDLGGAEGARGIDPQYLHLAGEEAQLLEGEAHRPLVGMAFGIGVELRRHELAGVHVALELVRFTPLVAKPPIAL